MQSYDSVLRLGNEKISKLLKEYALPAIAAMTATSLYNMTDSIFIGQGVGPMAISGLAVTFPFMNLAIAVSTLVGIGASTLISVSLGQKNYEKSRKILGNMISLNLIITGLFSILGLIFMDPILRFFGASDATIPYARDYMQIIIAGAIINNLFWGLGALLRSVGFPKMAMISTILTVILNAILNAIFIFILDWGIKGAAIATVVSQLTCLIWLLFHFSNKKNFIHFDRNCFKLQKNIVKNTLFFGLPPFLMNLCACLVVMIINVSLKKYGGDLSIGAFGIANRIVFVFIMIVFGLNNGIQPIAGYNLGARQYNRLKEVLRLGIFWGIFVLTIGFILCESIPYTIVGAFTTDTALIELSARGLRIASLVLPLIGFQLVITGFFQSIGMPKISIFLSLTRQLIYLIPALLILPLFYGLDGIWISIPVSDFLAFVTAAIVFYKKRNILNGEPIGCNTDKNMNQRG